MKQVIYAIGIAALLLACTNNDDLSITVSDSDDTYEFSARYDKRKTQQVQDFINERMAPKTKVEGDHVDISTTLDDNTRFKLEEYAGKVHITLDKDANTKASYRRIKSMCEGIKAILVEKPAKAPEA